VTLLDGTKVAVLLFIAAILQVSVFNAVSIFGGTPDVLLVTLIAIALLRGSIPGAVGGFFAGLVVDTATLEILGLSSLLYLLAGYWTGRYGETTGRDKTHAPVLAVGVITILYTILLLILRFLLGEGESVGRVLLHGLPPELLLNLLVTVPVYAFVRWVIGIRRSVRAQEVRLIE
jgi:rod shape-determining protein MreD